MCISVKLTVFFQEPFWVGVFESYDDNFLTVCRIVFGEEPKDYEIYEFLLKEYYNLKFSNQKINTEAPKSISNPKRLKKNIKKETESIGIGTKAQLAMKLQFEANKLQRKKITKEAKEQEQQRQYAIRQQKKKEKHRGH